MDIQTLLAENAVLLVFAICGAYFIKREFEGLKSEVQELRKWLQAINENTVNRMEYSTGIARVHQRVDETDAEIDSANMRLSTLEGKSSVWHQK